MQLSTSSLPLFLGFIHAFLNTLAAADNTAVSILNALRFKPLLAEMSRGSDLIYVPPNSFSHFKIRIRDNRLTSMARGRLVTSIKIQNIALRPMTALGFTLPAEIQLSITAQASSLGHVVCPHDGSKIWDFEVHYAVPMSIPYGRYQLHLNVVVDDSTISDFWLGFCKLAVIPKNQLSPEHAENVIYDGTTLEEEATKSWCTPTSNRQIPSISHGAPDSWRSEMSENEENDNFLPTFSRASSLPEPRQGIDTLISAVEDMNVQQALEMSDQFDIEDLDARTLPRSRARTWAGPYTSKWAYLPTLAEIEFIQSMFENRLHPYNYRPLDRTDPSTTPPDSPIFRPSNTEATTAPSHLPGNIPTTQQSSSGASISQMRHKPDPSFRLEPKLRRTAQGFVDEHDHTYISNMRFGEGPLWHGLKEGLVDVVHVDVPSDCADACFMCLEPMAGGKMSIMNCRKGNRHGGCSDCMRNWLNIKNVCPMCAAPARWPLNDYPRGPSLEGQSGTNEADQAESTSDPTFSAIDESQSHNK